MADIHWHPLPLFRRSPRARQHLRLRDQIRHCLRPPHSSSRPAPTDLEELLDLTDQLAAFINTPLLAGDTFALESEILALAFHPERSPDHVELTAVTQGQAHRLRYQRQPDQDAQMVRLHVPFSGQPVGVDIQSVGYAGAEEVVVLSQEAGRLLELRLARGPGARLHSLMEEVPCQQPLTAIGRRVDVDDSPIQVSVVRSSSMPRRPHYQLRVRPHARAHWTVVHEAQHPLSTPVFHRGTIYFTARASEIKALTVWPVRARNPLHLLTLETPSPIQDLLGYEQQGELMLVAATADGTLFALHPADRQLKWKFDSGRSITAIARCSNGDDDLFAVGTPDGLLEFFQPLEAGPIWERIDALIARSHLSLADLLERTLIPWRTLRETLARQPLRADAQHQLREQTAQEDRPYLRLLAIQRLLLSEQPPEGLERIREALLLAFDAAKLGSRLWQSEIIRFVTFLFTSRLVLIAPNKREQLANTFDAPLGMLFQVLEQLAPPAYGDARRRLERLLRRLEGEWMPVELFERYRQRFAPTLSLRQLSSFNFRADTRSSLEKAAAASSLEDATPHYFHALEASWRRLQFPLNRDITLQGLSQAVLVPALPSSEDDAPAPPAGWLLGLSPMGIRLLPFRPGAMQPDPVALTPLKAGTRLCAGTLGHQGLSLVAVVQGEYVHLYAFDPAHPGLGLLKLVGPEPHPREPVTALEMLAMPAPELLGGTAPVLALGQADGHFQLLHIRMLEAESADGSAYVLEPLLDLYWSTPVHHVSLTCWPEAPALIIGADRAMHLYHQVRLSGDTLYYHLEQLRLESDVTAFTIASPPSRQGSAQQPVLVVGLANGLVQAFLPTRAEDQGPELCWLYRAPQVITDLAYLPDPTGGWFVAAADDGALHLLRYGEPHHRVAVERYPFDLSPIISSRGDSPHLLVSSANRAVTLLEGTGADAMAQLERLAGELRQLLGPARVLQHLREVHEPSLVAMGLQLLRHQPLPELLEHAESRMRACSLDPTAVRTLLEVLLERAAQEPEARAYAYAHAGRLLTAAEVPVRIRAAVLTTLGARLDRIEEHEVELILTEFSLEDPLLARTYLKMLEHLWDRTQDQGVDTLLWWRGLARLGISTRTFDRRQLLPLVGVFARKLLQIDRESLLHRLRFLRDLEDSGMHLAGVVCEALALPHVLGDDILQHCIRQYGHLLTAQSPHQIHQALIARRDMFATLADILPQTASAREVYDDILEAFGYAEYDQYSRFLVDAPEFLPHTRRAPGDNLSLLQAFSEVRSRLAAVAPAPPAEKQGITQIQDRVQSLLAQSEVLQDFVRRWSAESNLEQQTVAAILALWKENILQPEIRRLQESVELSVRDLRLILPEEGGVVEVFARLHNLGGRALDGLRVGLGTSTRDAYLWEGSPEWCQGPIQFGQAIEYRTEILVEDGADRVTLHFELSYEEHEREVHRVIPVSARIEREEPGAAIIDSGDYQREYPFMFECLRSALLRTEPGRVVLLISDDRRGCDQLLPELADSLSDTVDKGRRAAVSLDLPSLLEGPPRPSNEALPAWWLGDRLARSLVEHGLIPTLPDRVDLRADPRDSLERMLTRALEGPGELWLVFKRVTRAFVSHPPSTLELARSWLERVATHSSHRIRILLSGDFALAARLILPPSPLYGRVDLIDVDQPYPPESPRALAEFMERVGQIFAEARLNPSELVRHKLTAHAGHSMPVLRKLIARLQGLPHPPWLQWQQGARDAYGEPEDLDAFLTSVFRSVAQKDRLYSLPFFHRLALVAVASARIPATRKELREGVVLASDVLTSVRTRANRPKKLYSSHSVLLEGDVNYLQVTVGEVQGWIQAALYRGLDFSVSLSHLLAVVGMERLLSDLAQLGLVRRHGHGTSALWAIQSPLMRRWLVTAYPFEPREEANLRNRLADDVQVLDHISLGAFVELHNRLNSVGRLHDLMVFLGLIERDSAKGSATWEAAHRRWERLQGTARRWVSWTHRPSYDHFRALVQEWAQGFNGELGPLDADLEEGMFAVQIDLGPLRIPRLKAAAVFGLTVELSPIRAERLREAVRRLSTLNDDLENATPGGAMGFVLRSQGAPGDTGGHAISGGDGLSSASRELLGERLIPLNERDLATTSLADEGRRAFLDLLARGGFRLAHISPYQPLGPLKGRAMDVLFVGREAEIDHVLRHPDQQVAIVGSRKIGKTSLLLKLKQELPIHLGPRARVPYIDCADLAPHQVWRGITDTLGLAPVDPGDARLELRRILEPLRYNVVLLLDEIDGIYGGLHDRREEAAERLMWDLRSLAAAGVIRVIFAGYVRIYERRRDPLSAWHNFTTFRKLSALSTDAARALVRGPLGALDIELASDSLIDLILERTYRVPWIVQLFCHQLISRLDERLASSRRYDRRVIREDVDGVSVQIEEELYTHFTSPRVMTSDEQLMLLTMVESGVHTFTENDVRTQLERRFGDDVWEILRFEDLPRSLDNLTLTLALTVESGAYSFPLEMYPTVIRSRLGDVRPRVNRLYDQLRRQRME